MLNRPHSATFQSKRLRNEAIRLPCGEIAATDPRGQFGRITGGYMKGWFTGAPPPAGAAKGWPASFFDERAIGFDEADRLCLDSVTPL